MDSRLGLKQVAAPPAGKSKVRIAAKSPDKREGPVWATVTIVVEHETVPKAVSRRLHYVLKNPSVFEIRNTCLVQPCLEYVEYVFHM